MRLLKNIKINFTKNRKIAFIISLSLIVIGIVSIAIHGGLGYGIDFSGGTLFELDFTPADETIDPIEIQELRDCLTSNGYGDSNIQSFGDPHHILIKIIASEDVQQDQIEIVRIIQENFPEFTSDKEMNELVRRSEHVGAQVGEELRGKAFVAILISLLGIIIYIWWRFEFTFGIAAVIALFHDVFITLGLISIFNIEISIPIVGALLTIVGYSLNDTIVLFVRIRENLKIYRKEKYESIINHSINEVLSRTIITSLSTLVVVVSLFIFGGKVIHDFSITLMFGVIIGTYSSIFVASPLLVEYHNWKQKRSLKDRHHRSKKR